ncbi:hypothetical protein MJ588_16070 [Klebsiella pneumoniae]|nr:hypothetical protein MJ588_16070 [Klebsiella pneumoniae]
MRKHGVTLALFAAGSTGLTAAINELGPKAPSTSRRFCSKRRYSDQVLLRRPL